MVCHEILWTAKALLLIRIPPPNLNFRWHTFSHRLIAQECFSTVTEDLHVRFHIEDSVMYL